MKIDNLYKIDKSEISHESDLSSAACFLVTLDKSHRIFTGHFPGTPVLPGVCTLQILKDCLLSLTGESLLFSNISQCKFTGMVDPRSDEKLSVNISNHKICDSVLLINATVSVTGSERAILKFKGKCSIL